MQIKQEKYALGKSKNIEITSKDFDIKADIKLNINEYEINIDSSISGIVTDNLGTPIKNALIKLMNNNLQVLATTKTDNTGKYIIDVVPLSSGYILLATSIGKLLEQSPSFSLLNKENKIINFILNNDNNSLIGGLSGVLVDSMGERIRGAVISLYRVTGGDEELLGTTYSDFEGEFLFNELEEGIYEIVISSLKFFPYNETITIESNKIYLFKKELKRDPVLSNGSISGIIADNFNNGILKADVVLYKIENNIKTPVAFTQSNSSGIYSFNDLPFGNYMVKSNTSQNTNLEYLITPSVKITSTSQLGTYNLTSGILENNTFVDYSTGFVTNIGGTKDGSIILVINIEKSGLYELAIQYVAADFNRCLKLEVNGKDNGEIYKVPITSGWTIDNSKIFNILTTLRQGANILKFHGDGNNLAPNLGTVTFIFNETEKVTLFAINPLDSLTYNVSTGAFGGGAKVNELTNFTENLGGADDGSSTVLVEVRDAMVYYLEVKYIAPKSNLNLKIDINDINDMNIYTVTKTKSSKVKDALTFTIPITLKAGKNTIKFHGDGKNSSPALEEFVLNLPPLEFELNKGILENEAKADATKNFVLGIGGKLNGSSTVRVNVNDSGKYKLFLKYVGTENNLELKVDINGVNTGTVYTLPKTKGLKFTDCLTFAFDIKLNSGNNSIKFYGSNQSVSPNLAFFSVMFDDVVTPVAPIVPIAPTTVQENYEIINATLSSPATFDKNSNFVTSLGGKNNGSCSIAVLVKHTGNYILTIGYRNQNRKFKIDINGLSKNRIYETTGDFIDTFSTLIDLNEGENILKFYGTGFAEELAPDLGDFTLKLNMPINLRLADGIFENGSNIQPSGIITGIGGPENGSFSFNYFASEAGPYRLNLIFSGEGRPIILDINNDEFPTSYNIPAVTTETVLFNINIGLEKGNNIISFYGVGEEYAPDLHSIEIEKIIIDSLGSGYRFFSQGELNNGAKVEDNTGFVIDVGGINNGWVKLEVNVPDNDYYDLGIKYLTKYFDTPAKLDVNEKTYSFTLPAKDYNSEPVLFTLSRIYLNKDKNILKFYGNGLNTVAKLDSFKIFKSPQSVTIPKDVAFYVKDGDLEPPAFISKTISNFVENIGGSTENGKKEGTSTVRINSEDKSGLYYLVLEYLADATSKNLAIDVNGVYNDIIYNFPETNSLKATDARKFSIPIMLNEGINLIKFRGDGSSYAPKLGRLEISTIPEDRTYNVSEGYLENNAMINLNTKFITNLGGNNNGSSTVLVNAYKSGIYYLTIKYLSPIGDSFIQIDIMNNNDANSSITHKFSKTLSGELKDIKITVLKVILTAGENKIKFHGTDLEKNKITPDLELFTVTSDDYVKTYDLTKEGKFSNGARKSSNPGFVTGLGGIKKGSILLNVDVEVEGLYDLAFIYIEEKSEKTLKIAVNEVKLSETLKIPAAINKSNRSTNSYVIPIELKNGNNLIKFSSKRGLTTGPTIGQITLTLIKSREDIAYGKHLISNGKLKNGATIDANSQMINNIGGKSNGEITVTFNAPFDGFYKLILQVAVPIEFLEKGIPCRLLIDVNAVSTKKEYAISTTLLDKPKNTDFKKRKEPLLSTLNVKIFLKKGENTIRFYGNGKDEGPLLGNYNVFFLSKPSTLQNIELLPSGIYYLDYAFADGILENGATIDLSTGFVTNIGGANNGFVTIEVNMPETGIYTLLIEYLALEFNLPFTMAINEKPTGNILNFEKCTSYSKVKSFTQKFKKGINKIKFYGYTTHNCPQFSKIAFVLMAKEKNN
ncbi:carboxypeptidase regulatory-like domain-containing protein [Clostridium tarantellae]|nr:carboxypeptidase regulatory-like domain-containing protein [Clostridium tarantellae]